jgi:hypothetical protein
MQQPIDRPMRGEGGIGRFRLVAWSLLFLCIVAAPGAANGVDLTGCYNLTVDDPGHSCRWSGPMLIAQTGTDLNGSLDLTRTMGGAGCLPVIVGTGTGTLTGSNFVFGVTSGGFGTATFTGTVSPDGQSATGSWVSSTPATGTWFAQSTAYDVAVDMTVTRPADGCKWTGPATFTVCADFDSFTASVALPRVTGGSGCPPSITGTLSGTATGTPIIIDFDLASSELGNAHFVGVVSEDRRSAAGTWSESENTDTGTWSARFHLPGGVAAPAMSGITLAALFGGLVAAGVLRARRRAI